MKNRTTTQKGSQVSHLQKTLVNTFHYQCAKEENNSQILKERKMANVGHAEINILQDTDALRKSFTSVKQNKNWNL